MCRRLCRLFTKLIRTSDIATNEKPNFVLLKRINQFKAIEQKLKSRPRGVTARLLLESHGVAKICQKDILRIKHLYPVFPLKIWTRVSGEEAQHATTGAPHPKSQSWYLLETLTMAQTLRIHVLKTKQGCSRSLNLNWSKSKLTPSCVQKMKISRLHICIP